MEMNDQKRALSLLQRPLVEGHHSENLTQGTKTLHGKITVFSCEGTLNIYLIIYLFIYLFNVTSHEKRTEFFQTGNEKALER